MGNYGHQCSEVALLKREEARGAYEKGFAAGVEAAANWVSAMSEYSHLTPARVAGHIRALAAPPPAKEDEP